MELPSMVQRSGDMLIVRSVVSGDQIYSNKFSDDESAATGAATAKSAPKKQTSPAGADAPPPKYAPNEHLEYQTHRAPIVSPLMLEQQLEMYCAAAVAQKQHFLQQQQQQQHAAAASAVMDAVAHQQAIDLKEEGLPQCKIKRNYSCTYCTYFTQNPRYHLTHLRDVHGEKIFINKCKLCLYASRHFQKLVRHMKMVHGCTDGVTGANGQSRGKRGMSREVRKRKLEESVGLGVGEPLEPPTMEQVKTEMDLQNQKLLAYKQHQTPDHQQLVQHATEAIYAVAANYERQLKEAKAMQAAAGGASLDLAAGPRQSSPLHSNGGRFRSSHSPSSLTRHGSTPSPSGSGSPSRRSTPNAVGFAEEAVGASSGQNRLVKCSMCDFATVYPGQLVEHEQEEHRKTKFFRCEKCSYVTHIKARFSKHVKYHSMPMIKCVTCDFRTPYKWNLDRHMKNHGGAGPFKCAACDFTADIKQSLTVHEMNHHVPPVGHAAGMSLARRRNKVGGTDLCDDFLSDSAELEDEQYPHNNNNNLDDYDDSMMLGPEGYAGAEAYGKRFKYDGEEPTDLSQKGGSSDTSSVHNQSIGSASKAKRSIPDLIPIKGKGLSALNLSKDFPLRSGLTDIASMFLTEKALSEILQSSADKLEASQLSPTTTVASMPSSQVSRGLLAPKKAASSVGSGSIFDRMKFSAAMAGGVTNENLVCPCGHMAKCLSESIIHRKTCKAAAMDDAMDDDDDEEPDDRLEIDFANGGGDDDDRQSHSALNLSVTGSTRCQHCRHRCKSSADLLNHLKFCTEVGGRYGNESPVSGESNAGRGGQTHDNRVSIWNKMPRNIANGHERGLLHEGGQGGQGGMTSGGHNSNGIGGGGSSEENSYYGVETAPGYGEVTKKMTPEEEAANSSLKKVYKCPHCSFWASTASRFHVHIVGHLNKKPFECSLCSYRSNWRWDITKHIRLKTIRDPSHKNARVLMNDETGRRNYTKYNKYITLMKVTEEDGDPKLMKSGEMTPNQVASLSFINDFNKSALSPSTVSHLNGLKDDITLEPVLASKKTASNGLAGYLDGGDQLADNLIHLPMFATMMNAAMAQQQHQQQQQNSREQEHATMITPSVTISAVKRSNSMPVKPSDDMIVEVKQEGNEKSTYYSCRKCSFRHSNRDAVLAHIKTHYADPNYPIVTATPTKVNSTYNKLLAAMCQQQNNNNNNTISNNNNKGLNLLGSGGLLQQAIQGGERPLSGLALALAGKKSPAESAGAILEHGEQKASQNEASARSATSPSTTTTTTTATPSNQTHGVGSSVTVAANTAAAASSSSPSLQHLLTSPRSSGGVAGSFTHTNTNHNNNNTVTVSSVSSSSINHHTNNNNKHLSNNNNTADGHESVLVAGKASMGVQADLKRQHPSAKHHSSVASVGSSASVTTLSSCTSATAGKHSMPFGDGSLGDGVGSSRMSNNNNSGTDIGGLRGDCIANNASPLVSPPPSSMTSSISRYGDINSSDGEFAGGGDGAGVGGAFFGGDFSPSNSNNNHVSNSHNNAIYHNRSSSNRQQQHRQLQSTTTTKQTAASTSQRLGDSGFGLSSGGGGGIGVGHAMAESPHPGVGNSNKSNNNHNTHANLITADGDRREPSPYRCGHCHQVSNWKHVIQRHCRLKHAGDIRIETLDRSSANPKPVYKSLEQQLSVNTNPATMNMNSNHHSNNNNNSTNKLDHLLNSPLANNAAIAAALSTIANAVANGGGNAQDIQAAAAYLAALNVGSAGGKFNMDDLMLHQQLQQNDQIEVTRLGGAGGTGTAASSNLAQLLENNNNNNNNQNASLPQNSKSKQQKCPLCPHVSESKSQMNYHISLHKPTQYECSLCTFVCAKKQHLSSHMRTVHHQQPQQQQQPANNSSAASLNMDFSMALQFAAAAKAQQQQQQQQQQQESASNQMVIDLTALKGAGGDSKAPSESLPLVSYCPRCPARFPHGRSDLLEHLKHHGAAHPSYRCKFCDFADDSDEAIQAHRYVHSARYQDKLDDLKAASQEDPENRPPKLVQITHQQDTVWLVDTDLGEGPPLKGQQQNAAISSSSASSASSSAASLVMATKQFDTANSLLKKQLEARPVGGGGVKRNASPARGESMATDESASEAGDSSNESVASHLEKQLDDPESEPAEKCMLCPYETKSPELYKEHLQHHASVSKGASAAFTCDHCDYGDDEKAAIEEHTRVHFNAMEKLASVAFFTSYDKLELSIEEEEAEAEEEQPKDEAEAPGQDVGEQLPTVKIKLEHHNNNNEDDAVNENVLQELLKDGSSGGVVKKEREQPLEEQEPPPPKPPTTKIILYKNDGCLSVKKDSPAVGGAEKGGDSISDRLRRRRLSRSAAGHTEQTADDDEPNDDGDDEDEDRPEQSHKILVNAKTGQVISKH